MLHRYGDHSDVAGVVVSGTIGQGQLDDYWCPECWWWCHVSRPCPCLVDEQLREQRKQAVNALSPAVGQLYQDEDGHQIAVTSVVTREGTEYAYCLSRAGEISVPAERLRPPWYRLARLRW